MNLFNDKVARKEISELQALVKLYREFQRDNEKFHTISHNEIHKKIERVSAYSNERLNDLHKRVSDFINPPPAPIPAMRAEEV